jgi:serine/threonine-protein kinase PknK
MGSGGGAVELGIAGVEDAVLIGSGGSGRVYRARQPHLDREVAVKIIAAAGDPAIVRRFERERRALGRLSGIDGILTIHDAGTTPTGDLYLITPYESHGSLRDRMDETGPMHWQQACGFIELAALAVDEAHTQGIVHRDLKPGNILITAKGRPVIADFGIARIATETTAATTTGLTLTPAYSPPEAFDDSDGSIAGDVYSLAATLWALIAGRPPFTEPGEQATMTRLIGRIIHTEVGDLRPLAPPQLCAVIERAMAKDPDRRHPRARDLADELTRARQDAAGYQPQPATPVAGWRTEQAAPDLDDTPEPTPTPTTHPTPGPVTPMIGAAATRAHDPPPQPVPTHGHDHPESHGTATPPPPAAAPDKQEPRRLAWLIGALGLLALAGTAIALIAAGNDDATDTTATQSETVARSGSDSDEATADTAPDVVTAPTPTPSPRPTATPAPTPTATPTPAPTASAVATTAPTQTAPGNLQYFVSPTGNIGCYVSDSGARCDITEHRWPAPPQPASCALDWGSALQISAEGAAFACTGDSTFIGQSALPYGDAIAIGGFRCESEATGVTCSDVTRGSGFFVSRESYELF